MDVQVGHIKAQRALDGALFKAIGSGVPALRAAVQAGANPDSMDDDGNTPLHIACSIGGIEEIKFLLSLPPKSSAQRINVVGKGGVTPLYVAAQTGEPAVLKLLLMKGANILAVDPRGNDALHLAVANGNEECVKILLDHGASPWLQDSMGHTSLHHAVSSKSDDRILDALLKDVLAFKKESFPQLSLRDAAGETVLLRLANHGGPSTFKKLLAAAGDAEKEFVNMAGPNGDRPLSRICRRVGDSVASLRENVAILIDAGADVNAPLLSGETALMYASFGGHTAIVRDLLAAGANRFAVNGSGLTAIDASLQGKHAAAFAALLEDYTPEGHELEALHLILTRYSKPGITGLNAATNAFARGMAAAAAKKKEALEAANKAHTAALFASEVDMGAAVDSAPGSKPASRPSSRPPSRPSSKPASPIISAAAPAPQAPAPQAPAPAPAQAASVAPEAPAEAPAPATGRKPRTKKTSGGGRRTYRRHRKARTTRRR